MVNKRPYASFFVVLCLIGSMLGCASTQPGSREYSCKFYRECAWCKAKFDVQLVSISAPTVEKQDNFNDIHTWWWADESAANKQTEGLYQQKWPSQFVTDGYQFCSLRCVNSYLASKDIKEKRYRIIEGE